MWNQFTVILTPHPWIITSAWCDCNTQSHSTCQSCQCVYHQSMPAMLLEGLGENKPHSMVIFSNALIRNAWTSPLFVSLISGFGQLNESDFSLSKKLHFALLPLVQWERCRARMRRIITTNMFCAGLPEGRVGSCYRDRGGAFVLKDDGSYWAAGITSWIGTSGDGCGRPGSYGLYTHVEKNRNWLIKTMQENWREYIDEIMPGNFEPFV